MIQTVPKEQVQVQIAGGMMVIPQERVQQRTEGRNIDVQMLKSTEDIA